MQTDQVLELIRIEYSELPGLKLTARQAQRLWDLSQDLCATALKALTESRFLVRTGDGAYVRCFQDVVFIVEGRDVRHSSAHSILTTDQAFPETIEER